MTTMINIYRTKKAAEKDRAAAIRRGETVGAIQPDPEGWSFVSEAAEPVEAPTSPAEQR